MTITIDQALDDKNLLGQFMEGDSWAPWRVFHRAVYALPPREGDLELFQEATGRTTWPTRPAREVWTICGRRSGKSYNAAILATHAAAFSSFEALAIGERATVAVISPTRMQSGIIKKYIAGFFAENPFLDGLIDKEIRQEINLQNKADIIVLTSDFRSMRGFSCPLVILDEAAFFRQEGSRTDTEAVRACRPALATLNGTLVVISSPWGKSGAVWQTYQQHYGVDGSDILVWQMPSRRMNPVLSKELIEKSLEQDPEAAGEWDATFRQDYSAFIEPETVDACTEHGCQERGPLRGVQYVAFTDMAGGSGRDSATLAIAHRENEKAILDLVREIRPPFQPSAVVEEFVNLLQRYSIREAYGDRYAGDWPSERFSHLGITYRASPLSKSQIYVEVLPLFNTGEAVILENSTLRKQLCSLERRVHAGGRQSVDCPQGRPDDVANAACGALHRAKTAASGFFANAQFQIADDIPERERETWIRTAR